MAGNPKRLSAEQSASQYLEMRGFEVIELNFRRSRYAIDLIAKKNDEIYFVKLSVFGHDSYSYELVAPSHASEMRLAAASWIEESEWAGIIHYSVIEIEQHSQSVMSFIQDFM